ncbi:hypothetical protein T02_9677 [Trichinella nativa]|uniref:Uncharacterized protein n=1 Tax=Trichinella nativa TaxID=6335 RepID=A0A0V1LH30_9BILA|nr:hypothetical protein T02_9677 [Trichinella nativa]
MLTLNTLARAKRNWLANNGELWGTAEMHPSLKMRLWVRRSPPPPFFNFKNQKQRKIGANLPGREAPIFFNIKWFPMFSKLLDNVE